MITLEQAKVGMANKVDQAVVDEFRRGSLLLDRLTFDNAVSPGTGGSTLGYTYTRLKTPSTATFRELNNDYAPIQAIREDAMTKLKIFGGNFELDRVIIDTSGAVDELQFQMQEKIKGAVNLFHYTVINGDAVANTKEFDGLSTILTGSNTEMSDAIDISTSTLMTANYQEFLDMITQFISALEDRPTMLMGNNTLITKIKGIARRAGYFSQTEDAFGRAVDNWDGIPLVDMRYYFDGANTLPNVPIVGGNTSLYAATFDMTGFHGISPLGNNIIKTALPDLTAPGVMKKGDVEMVAAVVLKNSRKAGVWRNIKVS